jgi:glycosyltransferase involved in cell wall biosynthesis
VTAAHAGSGGGHLGPAARRRPAGVRVVVDVRPLQEPDQAPVTAAYLGRLLAAFADDPLPGESFVLLERADLPDPEPQLVGLPIAGRRILPATRFLRAATQTVDPFLVRGASFGTGWRAGRTGAVGRVYHAAGTVLPLGSKAFVVATLLDLAAWELPSAFQRSPAARFGARLRAQLLRDATFVLTGTDAVARHAERRLHVPRSHLRVVPLAPRDAFNPAARHVAAAATDRERLGLPERYLVWAARHDARQDLPTLLAALAAMASAGRPPGLADALAWPPRILVIETSPADRAALARAAARAGLGDVFAYAPGLASARLAGLVAGARAAIAPVVSDSAGLAVIEALACAVPVVATGAGALPELVGGAGILVPPRAPDRLAAALAATWTDDALHETLTEEARARAAVHRSWADVAFDVRSVYAEAVAAG